MARASAAAASPPRAGRRAGARTVAAGAGADDDDAARTAAASVSASASALGGARRPRQRWHLSLKRLALAVTAARLAFLVLTFLLARLLPDYDTSAELASGECGADWPRRAAAAAAANAAPSSSSSPWQLPPPSPSSWGVVWDAAFYHRIAACGYEYEQFAAFFPGLPWVAGTLARRVLGLSAASHPLSPRAFAAAAVLVNNFSFVGAAVLLAHLGRAVLGFVDQEQEEEEEAAGEQQQPLTTEQRAAAERASLAAALLYGLQPAAVFTAIPYTEPLFSLLTFAGLCCLYCSGGGAGSVAGRLLGLLRFEAAALLFCLAASMRSNGAVNAAFLLHEGLVTAVKGIQRARREEEEKRGRRRQQRRRLLSLLPVARAAAAALVLAARACLCAAVVLVPYFLFQRHVAIVFCDGAPVRPLAVGVGGGGKEGAAAATAAASPPPPSSSRPDWCARGGGSKLGLRTSYAHVQARYWGVGPLAYWRPEQLPNFLLAFPALALTAAGALALYLRVRPATLLTGGLLPLAWEKKVGEAAEACWGSQRRVGRRRANSGAGRPPPPPPRPFSSSRRAAVFVVQWSALALFAALTMNVQVSTRMLCASCPAFYWAAAEMAGLGQDDDGEEERAEAKRGGGGGGRRPPPTRRRFAASAAALWVYCFGFALAGAVLNPQFLPWT